MSSRLPSAVGCAAVAMLASVSAWGNPPQNVVTTLADYEDNSIAIEIADTQRVLAADCAISHAAIPARGQRSLMVEIGATQPHTSAAFDLRFRIAKPFAQADSLATYAWINGGYADVAFRIRDATDRLFETKPKPLETTGRWVRLDSPLTRDVLTLVSPRPAKDAAAPSLQWPIEVVGFRVYTREVGRQTVFLDDLEVEHRASGAEVLQGEFTFSNPTRIYEPGARVRAGVFLENLSRKIALPLSVEVAWLTADGLELTNAQKSITLPPSGESFRSRQPVDFSQRVLEPGLYRLVARVSGPGWSTPAVFESTIAVMTSNCALPRGRETFFGIRSNLLRESPVDQDIEINIAREIGVQLLALDVPWRTVEPSPGRREFRTLETIIDRLSEHDIAVMLILVDAPGWLNVNAESAWQRQAELMEALVQRFGKRVTSFMPLLPKTTGGKALDDSDWQRLVDLQERLKHVEPAAVLMAPPIAVSGGASMSIPAAARDALPLAFETEGQCTHAESDLIAFGKRNDIAWNSSMRWFHDADSAPNAGSDAETILRYYMRGVIEGVGGVVWFDLRDDSAQPDRLDMQRGLVRRDFSPRMMLIGFANAVGMLHGLVYAGPVTGTPTEFNSALFIGGQTQVGVFFPKPNRVLPGLIAPRAIVPSQLTILDFARVEQPQFGPADAPLAQVMDRPFFVALFAERAQSEAQLVLARPWVRVPQVLLCGQQAELHVEIDAIDNLTRSYAQLLVPDGAGLESSASSRLLRASRGETILFDATIKRTGGNQTESIFITLRLRIEGETYEIPIQVAPLYQVAALERGASLIAPQFEVGKLRPRTPTDRKLANLAVRVGYERRELRLLVDLPKQLAAGVYLDFGLAAEEAEQYYQARITGLDSAPTVEPLASTDASALRPWQCERVHDAAGATTGLEITVPTRALDVSSLRAGMRFLAAVTLVEPPADTATSPTILQWGTGIGDPRRTLGYMWLTLAEK